MMRSDISLFTSKAFLFLLSFLVRAMTDPMGKRRSEHFHSHVYFEAATRASAVALQQALIHDLPGTVRVSRLVDRPIGPHPLPMFEIDFGLADYPAVRAYLEANRGPHTALIHQLTSDDIWDHTEGAEWVGPPVALNLQFLRDFNAGKVAGVNATVPFERKRGD